MNIKVLYNKNGDWGHECAVAIDNRITFLDTSFDNTLGEKDISLNEYKEWDIKAKIDDLIAHAIDGYYYDGIDMMKEIFQANFSRDISVFEVIEEKEMDKESIIKLIKFPTEEKFLKVYQEEIIKNIFD